MSGKPIGPLTTDDRYPLQRTPLELQRLRVQAESLAGEAAVLLDRIAVQPGWRCLDVGCGAGGIVDLLSARVGPEGRVVGLDIDAASIAAARDWAQALELTNASFVEGSVFDNDLAADSFDLVHLRYVMTTIARNHEVFAAAARHVRPGGLLVLQEADIDGLKCYPPHPAWDRLKRLLAELFQRVGDPYAGTELYRMLLRQGFQDIDFRPCQARARSFDDLAAYLPDTVNSVRAAVVKAGLIGPDELDGTLEAVRQHLARPETTSTSVTVIQAWGRKPG